MTTRTETPDILGNIMAGSPAPTLVALAAIVNDGGTQMRAGMDAATITEYEEAIQAADGWPFPPVVVYHDGEKYWLADGFHRVNAAHRSGKHTQIPAEVKAGTRRDAILYAAGANASHGLRRTNGDKRRAVEVLLKDDEWSQLSDNEIAKRCKVTQPFVSAMRKESTYNGYKSTPRTGADGRVYNTTNIGTNHPTRLFIGDLKGLVVKWLGQHWQHAWPDNPSHTNGEFWQKLTAWLHENVRESWQEADLKEAIKAIHAQATGRSTNTNIGTSLEQRINRAERQQQPALLAVWELEKVAREVCQEVYGAQPFALSDMRQGARMRQGRFWLLCVKTINGDNWRHADLAQAINNVAEQMAQRSTQLATDDLHPGAGRPQPPPLTVQELVEDLDGYLTGVPAAEIAAAARGVANKALETAKMCLADFTYRQADLYRALDKLALQRGAPVSDQQVDGDRPLPKWAEDAAPQPAPQTAADPLPPVPDDLAAAGWELRGSEYGRYYLVNARTARTTRSCATADKAFEIARSLTTGQWIPEKPGTTPAPVAAPSPATRHPQHDDLFEFSELFKLAMKEIQKWATMTGLHTDTLEAERGLRHLIERTDAILKDFDHA